MIEGKECCLKLSTVDSAIATCIVSRNEEVDLILSRVDTNSIQASS